MMWHKLLIGAAIILCLVMMAVLIALMLSLPVDTGPFTELFVGSLVILFDMVGLVILVILIVLCIMRLIDTW